MAYSRFIEADVYVFMHVSNYLYCCACWLDPNMEQAGFGSTTTQGMLDHLKEHEQSGHRVPPTIYADLLADDAENFPVQPK
jgi:hypothetical protein